MAAGGWGGIRVIQADGSSDYLTLSDHPSIDTRPSWSPDGLQIAFESRRDDPVSGKYSAIYTMNSDGSHLTRITNIDAFYAQPDWSPDGSRIVMISAKSRDAGDADLVVLDLSTGELTRLTDGPTIDMEPSWSPGGSQVAFTSDRDGSNNIFTINVDSGEITQLTQESGDNSEPDWSPDGEKILFVSNRDGDEEIYVMDADGANQSRLTTTPGKDVNPEWSPDGYYFAYGHEDAGIRKIYVSDLGGSPPELLFENPEQATAGHPAWTIAQETISTDPVIGPPFCARDTDGDYQPDTPSPTFTTEDDMAFIVFPYDNMQDGMNYYHVWSTPGELNVTGEQHQFWDGGEEGVHISYSTLQHSPGIVSVKLYLDAELSFEGKLMQEIECEVVEP
jgi:Tol biopolymer transport system component